MKGTGGAGLLDVHLWHRAALGHSVFAMTGMPLVGRERGRGVLV